MFLLKADIMHVYLSPNSCVKYVLNMYDFLYVNHTLMKWLKQKADRGLQMGESVVPGVGVGAQVGEESVGGLSLPTLHMI